MPININTITARLSQRINEHAFELSNLPTFHQLKDADRAGQRIAKAIANEEKILLVGDYDVDGVTSTAIIVDFFNSIDYPIQHVIPNRFRHGYGLRTSVIEKTDATLIITVDNGITSIEAGEWCAANGVDLIITDHHTPFEVLPKAYAIVNPKQLDCPFPFKEICGAQVAWYLTKSIEAHSGRSVEKSKFFDLLALAIIADVMPLIGLNREMVKLGLKAIKISKRPFFVAARTILGSNIDSDWIAFQVAPMLNASGRMKDAKFSLRALLAKDEGDAVYQLNRIIKLNKTRKEVERALTLEAIRTVDQDSNFIVAVGENWHEGVVGIVASRLVETFKKPAIVLTKHGDVYKGSGRTFGDFHLFDAVNTCGDLLVGFGGHKAACGLALTFDNISDFRARMDLVAGGCVINEIDDSMMGEIHPRDINLDTYDVIKQFEPFGEKNRRPKFELRNAVVSQSKTMGADKNHLKMVLSVLFMGKTYSYNAVKFNFLEQVFDGDTVDISFFIQDNEFNGRRSNQLFIETIKKI